MRLFIHNSFIFILRANVQSPRFFKEFELIKDCYAFVELILFDINTD